MTNTSALSTAESKSKKIKFDSEMMNKMTDRYHYTDEIKAIIDEENLLPSGLLSRLHSAFPQHSGLLEDEDFHFRGKAHYAGLKGFREINQILLENGIDIGHIEERELFIKVYRFLATKHVLNTINWNDFANDSVFQLVFPQPGMISPQLFEKYKATNIEEDKEKLIEDYIKETNPHDGKQKLNKPWFENDKSEIVFLEGIQHKYPQCQLLFDKSTQSCFAFCTYCFRHAQVRGDEDMFIQNEIKPVLDYMKKHKEVTDLLITGGDGGYMPYERLERYIKPIVDDPELLHIKSLRIGTRALTFHPELFLTTAYNKQLDLFKYLINNGVQVVIMAHFSTPRELMNPSTIAAVRRLRAAGIVIRSQSPVMNHISLFTDENNNVDIDRSAQNWIDLGHILSMLTIQFHSMYCARPTGEHHYFTVPLVALNKIFCKIYRSLPSISRPSRYITMTSSAGKTSILGETIVNGEKAFVLKFNESRNMEWMDKVFLAKYDDKENTIANLKPFDSEKYFFEDELIQVEKDLEVALAERLKK